MPRVVFSGLAAAALAVSGCVPLVTFDNGVGSPRPGADTPDLPPISALPPAGYVGVRLADGSPGLGLWCDLRGDCIEAARILCDNRQSIRSEFDIDRTGPGAAEYFTRSEGSPHKLTVSCPV